MEVFSPTSHLVVFSQQKVCKTGSLSFFVVREQIYVILKKITASGLERLSLKIPYS